jgi:hypothetical protein
MNKHREVQQGGKPLHQPQHQTMGGGSGAARAGNSHNRAGAGAARAEPAPEIKLTLEQSKEAIELVLVEVGLSATPGGCQNDHMNCTGCHSSVYVGRTGCLRGPYRVSSAEPCFVTCKMKRCEKRGTQPPYAGVKKPENMMMIDGIKKSVEANPDNAMMGMMQLLPMANKMLGSIMVWGWHFSHFWLALFALFTAIFCRHKTRCN